MQAIAKDAILTSGELKSEGFKPLGQTLYLWFTCKDCGTSFPVIRKHPSCNGQRISKCPFLQAEAISTMTLR